MLRRLKNLWRLSRYDVVEDIEWSSSGSALHPPRLVNNIDKPKKKLATIVDINPYRYDPENETN